jgi:hypothetical protein
MTDSPKPSDLPDAQVPIPPPHVQPRCALLAMCVECGQGIELPMPFDQRGLGYLLALSGWFISMMSPPGQGPDAQLVLGPLCTACAQQVYPPEVFAAAEQRRQQLLQSVAEAHAQAQAAQAAQSAQGQGQK